MLNIDNKENTATKKGGDCYEANGSHLLNMGFAGRADGLVLVHGVAILKTDGKPFGHCWLEKGDTVYDYSNGRNIEIDKDSYYMGGGMPVDGYKNYKYTLDEVREKVIETGHWGWWDSKPPR